MSNYGRLVAETTDQYLAALDAAQQNFLKSFATFSASLPASPMSSQPAMPGLPTVQEGHRGNLRIRAEAAEPTTELHAEAGRRHTPSEVPTAPAVAFGKAVSPKTKNAN